ncbi:hypothetical protein F0562_017523 [Nyssa sinensis]|uniref:Retrotransposon Copia-like N-terminal domain-containing protein n=1 Tax=Nyssa sinensis TaxID=561372 RepID=A0A5J4ZFA8_9ASTE|nr:hypothetical protein F0562_017523 [Nyssa sinensis]
MAIDSPASPSTGPLIQTMSDTQLLPNHLVAVNSNQLPLKLKPSIYPSWKAQFDALRCGYDLLGYIDGTNSCPSPTIETNGQKTTNPAFTFWMRQDKLLFLAIIGSLDPSIVPLVSSAQTSAQAWSKLASMYANRSCTRIMGLKESLMNISRGLNPVADYLRSIKSIADDLALAGAPLDNLNLVMHTLNGLGSDFKELAAAIRARDSVISFEELYNKLVDYESFLKRAENQSSSITANATRFNTKSDTTPNYRKGGHHSDQNRSQGKSIPSPHNQGSNLFLPMNHHHHSHLLWIYTMLPEGLNINYHDQKRRREFRETVKRMIQNCIRLFLYLLVKNDVAESASQFGLLISLFITFLVLCALEISCRIKHPNSCCGD